MTKEAYDRFWDATVGFYNWCMKRLVTTHGLPPGWMPLWKRGIWK